MSLNSLAKQKAANIPVPVKLDYVSPIEADPPSPSPFPVQNSSPSSQQNDLLAGLTKYIPTESITLYVAAVSAQKAIGFTPQFTYYFFVAFTPILLITLFLRQLALENKPYRIPLRDLPWWRTVASTIAFAIWALAIPGNPIISSDNSVQGAAAGFGAVFVSTVLNVLEPFFD